MFRYIVDANQDSKIDMGELRLAYDRIALHDTISEIFWYLFFHVTLYTLRF